MSVTTKSPLERRSELARALVGLLVVWGSFYLVAKAQEISTNKVRLRMDAGGPQRENAILSVISPQAKGLLQFERARFTSASPRSLLRSIFRQAGFAVSRESLNRVSDAPIDFRLGDQPFFATVYRLLDGSNLGFGLRGNRAEFFSAAITARPEGGHGPGQAAWRGEIPLTDEPIVIFPVPSAALWVAIALQPESSLPAIERPLHVEYGSGPMRKGSKQAKLGEFSSQSLGLDDKSVLMVEIKPAATVRQDSFAPLCEVEIRYEAPGEDSKDGNGNSR
ncbi:hypothetical protein HYR69_08180 [Candidatus Sumerlaeota bacterium]|nr:hypothetical protein [Candidatus Sumerlaeota bacterium]